MIVTVPDGFAVLFSSSPKPLTVTPVVYFDADVVSELLLYAKDAATGVAEFVALTVVVSKSASTSTGSVPETTSPGAVPFSATQHPPFAGECC